MVFYRVKGFRGSCRLPEVDSHWAVLSVNYFSGGSYPLVLDKHFIRKRVPNISGESEHPRFQSASNPEFSGSQQLLDSELGLINYTTAIVSKFHKKMNLSQLLVSDNDKMMEFGAGTGFLASIMLDKFGIRPECVELDPELANLITVKGFTSFRFLKDSPRNYSHVYTSNVLEHIQDDNSILRELYDSIIPGGFIGIYVPAHPLLYSEMDRQIGHVRRYTKSEIRTKVELAGFEIEILHYDDFLGFFASLFVKCIGYKKSSGLGSLASLVFYDKIIYPVSKVLDLIGFRYVLGKNLFMVARKRP